MKTNIIYIILFLFGSLTTFGQSKTTTATIKVFGNCEMCKKRIETALDQPGIKMANWDTKSKNLEVVFNSRKISEQKIHDLVAAAGHDTERVKAKNEVYAELPFCCLYRDHDHSGMKDESRHPHK
jgi:periplasmic mercuric ion binding protein